MRMPECVQVLQGLLNTIIGTTPSPTPAPALDERGYFGHSGRNQLVRGRAQRRVRPQDFAPRPARRSTAVRLADPNVRRYGNPAARRHGRRPHTAAHGPRRRSPVSAGPSAHVTSARRSPRSSASARTPSSSRSAPTRRPACTSPTSARPPTSSAAATTTRRPPRPWSRTVSTVTPAPKTLVLDLNTVPGTQKKIEGVAVVNPWTIALINDNDFGMTEDRARSTRRAGWSTAASRRPWSRSGSPTRCTDFAGVIGRRDFRPAGHDVTPASAAGHLRDLRNRDAVIGARAGESAPLLHQLADRYQREPRIGLAVARAGQLVDQVHGLGAGDPRVLVPGLRERLPPFQIRRGRDRRVFARLEP